MNKFPEYLFLSLSVALRLEISLLLMRVTRDNLETAKCVKKKKKEKSGYITTRNKTIS